MAECITPDCGRPSRSRKMCRTCYQRFQRAVDKHNARIAAGLPSREPTSAPPAYERADSLEWMDWDLLDIAMAVPEATMLAVEWQPLSRCARPEHADVDMFPEDTGGVAPAKAVCVGCPVVYECLAYSLRTYSDHGVFGRTSQRERVRIRVAQEAAKTARARRPSHRPKVLLAWG